MTIIDYALVLKLTEQQREFFNEMILANCDTFPILEKHKKILSQEQFAEVLACIAMSCYIKVMGLDVEKDEMPHEIYSDFYNQFSEERKYERS